MQITSNAMFHLLDEATAHLAHTPTEYQVSVRARLFRVLENPSQKSWEASYLIGLADGRTVWKAAVDAGFVDSEHMPGEVWAAVPPTDLILDALKAATSANLI